MGASLKVKRMGLFGVNVDKDPQELQPEELRQSQNAIHEPLGANKGLVNRPGLVAFNDEAGEGSVLGGIGLLEPNASSGLLLLYIGRGGSSD